MTFDNHILFSQRFRNIFGGVARNSDPGLREEGARDQNEKNIEKCVEGIFNYELLEYYKNNMTLDFHNNRLYFMIEKQHMNITESDTIW